MENVTSIAAPVGKKPLTGVLLTAFFSGTEAKLVGEKIAQVESSRLSYLFSFFPTSTLADIATAVRDMKKQAETDAKGDKHAAGYRSAQKRGREVQLLYGGWSFVKIEPNGGYHDTVQVAREALRNAGLSWKGEHKLDKDEKNIRKQADIVASEYEAVEQAKLHAARKGEKLSPEKIEETRIQTRAALEKAGAVKMAKALYKTKGEQFSLWLIEALEISIIEGSMDNKEEAVQTAVAA